LSSIVTILSISAPLAAQQLVPQGSEIRFVVKQMGVPVEGVFKKFDANLKFNTKEPATGKINMSIDLTSVDMGEANTNKELTKPGWFDSTKFPKATFETASIKSAGKGKAGESLFDLTGKLSIKGKTKDIPIKVTLVAQGKQTLATGSFVIKRLDFNIGEGDWNDTSLVANDIEVKFKLNVSGLPL
jgi:polyisoprenoid-binding protein YceI